MTRSCEKFGCRTAAQVAFGIDRIACVVWLETYDENDPRHLNRLCRDHAGRLILPRGWSFDDRRERSPRLFVAAAPPTDVEENPNPNPKPRRASPRPPRKAASRTGAIPRRTSRDATPQLKRVDGPGLFDPTLPIDSPLLAPPTEAEPTGVAAVAAEPDARPSPAYAPKFDRTSDVGGALNATGRLLRRAFSSQTRPLERPVPGSSDTDSLPQGDHIDDFHQGEHIE